MKKSNVCFYAITLSLITAALPILVQAANITNADSTISSNSANSNNGLSSNSWDSDNQYWRSNYASRPYYNSSRDYSVYEPAYRYGMDLYKQNPGRNFSDIDQNQLNTGWTQARGNSTLSWDDAKAAVQDEYNRIAHANASISRSNPSASSLSPSAGPTTKAPSNYINTH